MKYSNYLGVIVALLLIAICFVPWVYIEIIDTVVTGLRTDNTNFGKPGLMNIILCVIASGLFITPTVWAKRINVFVCTFNLAWSARNYLLITQCELGDCPRKLWGIYVLILLSLLLLVLSLFPKLNTGSD